MIMVWVVVVVPSIPAWVPDGTVVLRGLRKMVCHMIVLTVPVLV